MVSVSDSLGAARGEASDAPSRATVNALTIG
jgi:hypothetical protein